MISTSEVLKETSAGILQGLGEEKIHIDMSTVSPSCTREIAERFRSERKFFLHSPVLGSVPQATEGALLLFVGGDEEAYKRSEEVLRTLGRQIWRFDRVDQASHTKLLCNMFIAGMITTLVQAIVFVQKAGINPQTLLDPLRFGPQFTHVPKQGCYSYRPELLTPLLP